MTDQSAFEKSKQDQETPENKTDDTNPYANQLQAIKNESGQPKYDSVEKALEALNHSQEYIPQLKADVEAKDAAIAELKEKLAQAAAVEDVVNRLKEGQELPRKEQPSAEKGLSQEDVLAVVQEFTAKQAAESAAANNEASVSKALLGKYGDKTQEVVERKAKELNISVDSLREMSQNSPAVVLSLFQATASKAGVTVSEQSTSNNSNEEDELLKPEKSLLRGASDADRIAYMRKIKEKVYKKYDVTV